MFHQFFGNAELGIGRPNGEMDGPVDQRGAAREQCQSEADANGPGTWRV